MRCHRISGQSRRRRTPPDIARRYDVVEKRAVFHVGYWDDTARRIKQRPNIGSGEGIRNGGAGGGVCHRLLGRGQCRQAGVIVCAWRADISFQDEVRRERCRAGLARPSRDTDQR